MRLRLRPKGHESPLTRSHVTFLATADADRQLATDAAGGDDAAFAAIFERHRGEIYRIARAVAGDRETALDAVQETFLKVHEGLSRFRAASSLRTWIVRIAVRAAIDQRRRARRARRHPTAAATAQEPSHDPRAKLDDELAFERVRQLSGQLPGQQGLILRLRLLVGLTNPEIAEVLKLQEPNVRMQVSKAVKRLREML
jgi:RNA polymerase sigma factor (sigma-70 family)